jgi:signal transduction histidine kinase
MELKEVKRLYFIEGGGEMGELIRSKDWSQTPLGSPGNWPSSLRTAVMILLHSRFPMFVWWGEEMITIYNDAYRIIAGEKHPQALGRPGMEVWPEIWDVVGPLAQLVMKEGRSNWAEDQLLFINRRGYVEESYFTFSYSPVLEESGKVGGVFCACTETTEKVLVARKVQESERNLRNTILQAPVAMCILKGPNFMVEIANEKILEIWGKSGHEMFHRPFFDALPEARFQGFEELLVQVYTTGETYSANERAFVVPQNGIPETAFINFVYEPFRECDGSISGVMVVAMDVTTQVIARRKIEDSEQELQHRVNERTDELEKANNELKRSNANLEEFAYAVSHDLKEPIRKIQYFSDRLKNELSLLLNEQQNRLFQRMQQATVRMGGLIEDLLDYSHISNSAFGSDIIDLNKIVRLVLEDLELEIQEKNAVINSGTLPEIKGHERQIQQLFQNLIGNSIKYSRPGVSPVVDISAEEISGNAVPLELSEEEASRDYHFIHVRDNGIGFEQKEAERIFNVFTRLHGKSEYSGNGVGLSIARKVMDNHRGYIWAEGRPDEGAVFHLLLPKD